MQCKYGTSSSGGSFSTIHWELTTQYFYKKQRGTVSPFHSGYIRHSYGNKIEKKHPTFTAFTHSTFPHSCENFTTDREVNKEVADGLLDAEEVGNRHFEAFL